MIEFNVSPTRVSQGHANNESLRERTAKWWTCSEDKLTQFGDIAFAVEANIVTGVFRIISWVREPASGKVELRLVDLPDGHPATAWLGLTAPVPWEPGQRQPFKYVSRNGLLPAAPTYVPGRLVMSQIADSAARYIIEDLAGAHPAPKVTAAYEAVRVVFGLMRSGSPFPDGPRVMDRFTELTPEIAALEIELSKFANRVAVGRRFDSSEEADQYTESAVRLLRHLSHRLSDPRPL